MSSLRWRGRGIFYTVRKAVPRAKQSAKNQLSGLPVGMLGFFSRYNVAANSSNNFKIKNILDNSSNLFKAFARVSWPATDASSTAKILHT